MLFYSRLFGNICESIQEIWYFYQLYWILIILNAIKNYILKKSFVIQENIYLWFSSRGQIKELNQNSMYLNKDLVRLDITQITLKFYPYLLEIPEKYGINIDIMIEAKAKELSIHKLYTKYPQCNCLKRQNLILK